MNFALISRAWPEVIDFSVWPVNSIQDKCDGLAFFFNSASLSLVSKGNVEFESHKYLSKLSIPSKTEKINLSLVFCSNETVEMIKTVF